MVMTLEIYRILYSNFINPYFPCKNRDRQRPTAGQGRDIPMACPWASVAHLAMDQVSGGMGVSENRHDEILVGG